MCYFLMCCLVKCGETICGFLWTFGDQFVDYSFWQNGNTGSTGERTKRASEQATDGVDIESTTTTVLSNRIGIAIADLMLRATR